MINKIDKRVIEIIKKGLKAKKTGGQIAKTINRRGFKTVKGLRWSQQIVSCVAIALGLRQMAKKKRDRINGTPDPRKNRSIKNIDLSKIYDYKTLVLIFKL